MAMVVVDDHSPSHVAWSEGRQLLGAVLNSSMNRVNSRNDLVVMMTAL